MRTLLQLIEKMSDHGPKNKWVTLSVADLAKDPALADEFVQMIQHSYRKIGGHVEFKNAQSFFSGDALVFDAIDHDDDPEADILRVAKISPYGKKSIATATDDTPFSKASMITYAASSLKKPGFYAEVSDAMAHILITKELVPFVSDEATVRKVLKKDIVWIGAHPDGKYPGYDGWYIRKLGPKEEEHLKIMVGIPKV